MKHILFILPIAMLLACGESSESAEKEKSSKEKGPTKEETQDPSTELKDLPEDEPFSLEYAEDRPTVKIWIAREDNADVIFLDGEPVPAEVICDAIYDFYMGGMVPKEMISESIAEEKITKYDDLGDKKYSNNWKTAKQAAKKLGIFERIKDGYVVEIGKDDKVEAVKYEEMKSEIDLCYSDLRDQFALEHFNSIYEDLSIEDKAAVRIAFPNRIVEKK